VSKNTAKLVDGDLSTSFDFPEGAGRGSNPLTLEFHTDTPFSARSLSIVPSDQPFAADCELQAELEGEFKTVRRFRCERSNMNTGVGFMPRGPVTVAFPAVHSSRFRVSFTNSQGGQPRLAEVALSGAARLESYVEKQLGKMHPTPLPMWDAYLWKTQSEPDSKALTVPAAAVQNITKHMTPDGKLRWRVPPGNWIILRTGMTPTGVKNAPASPEGQGLEVDKMNQELAQRHFDSFIGEILRRVPAADRKAFKRVVADSYETGSQNWTDGLEREFTQTYGYDPRPWLPVLTGRLVGSADESERFLWDLRRLVADKIATDYVGGLRRACKPHGLQLWLENYGHWGFPSEFLKYGGASDRVGGEYWVTGDLGSIECRAASSCANTYGKPFVSAEAFTGGPAFQNSPAALKARGDWSFCEGVNHFVLHVYIQQPWEDKVPGVNAWFGTEFNRHNTWFEESKSWFDYLRRSCWMLQQGTRVADVAYFIGEDAPKMTGIREPALPTGRDFDYLNSEIIENSLAAKDGLLTLPHGVSYRVLVLPKQDTMRPELLRKISKLITDGATIVGIPPVKSPSMEDYPKCDEEVRDLANEIWANADTSTAGERKVGKGRIIWGKDLETVLASLGSVPDFDSAKPLRFTHRRSGTTDIYFVANPKPEPLTATVAFRAGDRAPEVWWPDTGRKEVSAVYEVANGRVQMPLSFGPHGSAFVVFRAPASPASERIVSVQKEGQEVLSTKLTGTQPKPGAGSANNFTFAVWAKPSDDTTLLREATSGISGMAEKRNDALAAPHGNTFAPSGHAGSGLAIGRNGVCVFEHAANYFAPTLVHAANLTDWTHVAVVYRDGQPNLYLNGKHVKTGLKSLHVVHPGASGGGQSQFRGRLGSFEEFPRALSDSEVATLATSMTRPEGARNTRLQITREDSIWKITGQPGRYEFQMGDGATRSVDVKAVGVPLELDGSWQVRFAPEWGGPKEVIFDGLVDWTERPEPGIKYYSGQAWYRKAAEVPEDWAADHGTGPVLLDLGEVRDLATVRVNGQTFPTQWHAPWITDIRHALKCGENIIEVGVVNPWNNRLVGDQALPPDQRLTFLQAPTVGKSTPLIPAGLLGPVVVEKVPVVTLEVPVRDR
jgi:hypothetical protein